MKELNVENQPNTLPSVGPFLKASRRATLAIKALLKRDIPGIFPISFAGSSLYGEEVIGCIEELEEQAKRLKLLESILPLFARRPSVAAIEGGIMSAASRSGKYTPQAYFEMIESEFSNCTFDGGTPATELRCKRGFCLYHLGNEFRSFQAEALSLLRAAAASKALLKAPTDDILRQRVKSNISPILDFHQREFTEIIEHDSDGTSEPFILRKIASYDKYRGELEGLAAVWWMDAADIMASGDTITLAASSTPSIESSAKGACAFKLIPLTSNDRLINARSELEKNLLALRPSSYCVQEDINVFLTLRNKIKALIPEINSVDFLQNLAIEILSITRAPDVLQEILGRVYLEIQSKHE